MSRCDRVALLVFSLAVCCRLTMAGAQVPPPPAAPAPPAPRITPPPSVAPPAPVPAPQVPPPAAYTPPPAEAPNSDAAPPASPPRTGPASPWGTGAAAGGAAPVVAASGPNEVTVWCVAYYKYDGKSHGTCRPVHIQVGGRARDEIRVGFYESEVGGTGNQWRSAGWSAALAAAQLTEFDPRSMQVSFDYEGRVDGPSAGGLMTIGVLAAVRGDEIRQDAAMTGTINPDGTIGPVGGIPYKIEGAAEAGKKLILIPAGIRLESIDDGSEVDLIKHGRDLGIEVRPVVDVYAAYKLMTGADLPRHPPAEEPRTTEAVDDLARSKVQKWVDRFQVVLNDYKERTQLSRTQDTLNMMQKGVNYLQTGQKLASEGDFGVAYWDAMEGTAYAYLAAELSKDIHAAQVGGRSGMADRVRDNGWLKDEVRDFSDRLRNETPQTLDQLSMYVTACSAFYEALALQATANAQLATVPEEPTQDHDMIVISASAHQILAFVDLMLAGDLLDFMSVCEGLPIPENAPIDAVAGFYIRAGQANTAVFDALIIDEYAKELAVGSDTIRSRLLSKDEEYAVLYGMQEYVLPTLAKHVGTGEAYPYARLAAGLAIYPRSAGQIAKYYSLGADLDETTQITGIRRERTFYDWLDSLQDRTRRSIGFLQARGLDMSLCAHGYEISRVRRQRELSDRFRALNDLLFVYTQSECIRRLAGYKLTDPAPSGE